MKRVVLFVDDEPNIISGLKRSLKPGNDRWDILLAPGGRTALETMARRHVDVLVTDILMPEMDGMELLERVRREYPSVIRIVLSGVADREKLVASTRVAHQFLVKPVDTATLQDILERFYRLRHLIDNRQILDLVSGVELLPSMPDQYLNLVQTLSGPDVSIKQVADIITQDPSMAAKVLQLVNSAFFGLPQKVSSPHQAVALLGLDIIRALVQYVKVFSIWDKHGRNYGFGSPQDFWNHSVSVSTLSKKVAAAESLDQAMITDAFVSGLLHDIGKLVLYKAPTCRQKLKALSAKKEQRFQSEYELFGFSHAEVGGCLLGLWGLPDNIVEAVAYHHDPAKTGHRHFSAFTAVHLANALASCLTGEPHKRELKFEESVDKKYLAGLSLKHSVQDYLSLAGIERCH